MTKTAGAVDAVVAAASDDPGDATGVAPVAGASDEAAGVVSGRLVTDAPGVVQAAVARTIVIRTVSVVVAWRLFT